MRSSDWSSDVCSSDLPLERSGEPPLLHPRRHYRIKPGRTGRISVDIGRDFYTFGAGLLDGGQDRKCVVSGKSVSVRVDIVGRRIIKKITTETTSARTHTIYNNKCLQHTTANIP